MPKPRILKVRTGGTIDMVEDQSTGKMRPARKQDEIDQVLSKANLPQLSGIADIDISNIMNKDSSDMVPDDWKKIARSIYDNKDDYDGFLVTHGTDTLHYTAAALSFMLQNLNKPIVLTGAQIALTKPGSDAPKNLCDAAALASYKGFNDVSIVFNGNVIRGTRAKKVSTTSLDAFASYNHPLLGTVKDTKVSLTNYTPRPIGEPTIETTLDQKVGHLKIFPGMNPEIVDWYVENGYSGLIIEGFGSGNANTEENSFVPCIKKATDYEIPVFICTQCNDGKVSFAYEVGDKLAKVGAIGLYDMLPEVAVVKLMYAAGKTEYPGRLVNIMTTPLAGEMTV